MGAARHRRADRAGRGAPGLPARRAAARALGLGAGAGGQRRAGGRAGRRGALRAADRAGLGGAHPRLGDHHQPRRGAAARAGDAGDLARRHRLSHRLRGAAAPGRPGGAARAVRGGRRRAGARHRQGTGAGEDRQHARAGAPARGAGRPWLARRPGAPRPPGRDRADPRHAAGHRGRGHRPLLRGLAADDLGARRRPHARHDAPAARRRTR